MWIYFILNLSGFEKGVLGVKRHKHSPKKQPTFMRIPDYSEAGTSEDESEESG
jgi:hypothetical protein